MRTLIKTWVNIKDREEESTNAPSEVILDFLHGWLKVKTGRALTRNEKSFSDQQHYEQRHLGEEYMACTEMSVFVWLQLKEQMVGNDTENIGRGMLGSLISIGNGALMEYFKLGVTGSNL